MAVGEGSVSPDKAAARGPNLEVPSPKRIDNGHITDEAETEDGEEQEEEDEDEPRLKYATLTKLLSSLYRNGDASSAVLVAGDKSIVGTQNGNIHVLSLPSFQPLKVYRGHSASVSSLSISPYPPPLPTSRLEATQRLAAESADEPAVRSPQSKSSPRAPLVPNTSANHLYIASSSIDGNVCVQSLVDQRDVQLRNFGRPVLSVALSPEYKADRNYLSGGQAGMLILTSGGQTGRSANAATTGAAAAASGWLGSIGLGSNSGTDRVLHSGEGLISTIKWSVSARYVLWVNEEGIKIMRSNLQLESAESRLEWKRLNHIGKPARPGWDEMAGVWKARVEWIDREGLEKDDERDRDRTVSLNGGLRKNGQLAEAQDKTEDAVVGWGDTVWLIKVYPTAADAGKEQNVGRAEITRM